jgi:mRNA interferase MazF
LIPKEQWHDARALERLAGKPRSRRWLRTRKNATSADLSDTRLNQILPVVNVLPITSRKRNRRVYPNEAQIPAGRAGLDLESIVLCYQIRTVDKQRLVRHIGELDETKLRTEILAALRFQLAMPD